jgi:hypothetical protein
MRSSGIYLKNKALTTFALFLSFIISLFAQPAQAQDGMGYWESKQRLGANSFLHKPPSQDYFEAFAEYGGEWVRITWTKWDSASGGTFLIGDPSNYTGLVLEDVAILKAVVAGADRAGLKVVFTPLSLPGAVWSQHNGDKIDDRLYSDKKYWAQSAAFWADLADVFKDNPAIAAYNILNEPTPERPAGYESGSPDENMAWFEKQKGTARDLPAFYNYVIAAIRKMDPNTPIMVDGGFFANPDGFSYFSKPLKDDKVLYAFHMAKPWAATSVWNVRNGSKLVYPGEMEIWGHTQIWNAEKIEQTMQEPLDWAIKHGIDTSRVVMSEFGCHRLLKWCSIYMEDVLTAAAADDLHWAFYDFRPDSWGGRDYELGNERPSKRSLGVTAEEFWNLSDQNRLDEIPRSNTPLFQPISKRLKANKITQKN